MDEAVVWWVGVSKIVYDAEEKFEGWFETSDQSHWSILLANYLEKIFFNGDD